MAGSKYPTNISVSKGTPDNLATITVLYSDDTDVTYFTEGTRQNVIVLNCPGSLTYVRREKDGPVWYYVYSYSESGINFGEFDLGWWEN